MRFWYGRKIGKNAGIGIRLTKKNFWWAILFIGMYYIFYYSFYAMFVILYYAFVYPIKLIIKKIKEKKAMAN